MIDDVQGFIRQTARQLETLSGWIDSAVTEGRDPLDVLDDIQQDLTEISWRLDEVC